jgi:hypothetical protein
VENVASSGSQLGGKRFAVDEEFQTEMQKWLRQQRKDFCVPGFGSLVKRWNKCIDVGGGYVEKLFFFPGSNITYFRFYVHL